MSPRPRIALFLFAACALLACENRSSGLDSVVRPATLAFYGDQDSVALPDTAFAGQPFTVRVRSYGGGCVSKDQTFSGVSGRSAYIRPFVREPAPGADVACPAILLTFSHDVELVFEETGQATIRVYGLREPERTPYSITRTVHVAPPRPVLHNQ